jgi:hypothetical protein
VDVWCCQDDSNFSLTLNDGVYHGTQRLQVDIIIDVRTWKYFVDCVCLKPNWRMTCVICNFFFFFYAFGNTHI